VERLIAGGWSRLRHCCDGGRTVVGFWAVFMSFGHWRSGLLTAAPELFRSTDVWKFSSAGEDSCCVLNAI
jgi:hypothetical protein